MGADLGPENGRVVEQLPHALEGVQGLDETRVVIVEAALDDAAETMAVLLELRVGLRRATAVDDVETRERADAVDAVGVAGGLVVRRLHVGVRERRLADVGRVVVGLDLVGDDAAVRTDEAKVSVIKPQRAVRPDEAAVHRGEIHE